MQTCHTRETRRTTDPVGATHHGRQWGHRLLRQSAPRRQRQRVVFTSLIAVAVLAGMPVRAEQTSSAFAVADGRSYVTAYHAVQGATLICIETVHGDAAEAHVLAVDPVNDLALLRSAVTMPPLALAASHQVVGGMALLTIGYPDPYRFGDDPKAHQGTLDSMVGILGEAGRMQVSVPVRPGNSGSPLLSERGQVVGVVVASVDSALLGMPSVASGAVGYAVPIDPVRQLIRSANGPEPAIRAGAHAADAEPRNRRALVHEAAMSVVLVTSDPRSATCAANGDARMFGRQARMSHDLIPSVDLLRAHRNTAAVAQPTPMSDLASAQAPRS